MKCIRCNKDFQDGEGNLCPECKKKFELEQSTSQNAKTTKINPFKRFYANKVKMYLTQKEKVKNLAIGVGAFLILIIIFSSIKGKGGNIDILGKIGNLREYGYADRDNGWIYYVAPDAELSKMGIYKVKDNGDKVKELNIIGKFDIMSLNAYKNYLYFIVQSSTTYSKDGDNFDNKIYKMKMDGTELEVINDNEFHNNCETIYVIDDWIYYIGVEGKLYKMSLDGKTRKKVSEETFSTKKPANKYVVTDKFIIYNVDNPSTSVRAQTTKIMGIDGKDSEDIIPDEYLSYLDMDSSYIYYTDNDNKLCKTKIKSQKKEEVYSLRKVYHLNVSGNYAYFYSFTDNGEVALYRLNLNSPDKGAQAIKILNNTAPCLNLVGDKIYYTDRDAEGGFAIKLLNTKDIDDTTTIYSYKFTEPDTAEEKSILDDLNNREKEDMGDSEESEKIEAAAQSEKTDTEETEQE